jgi:hypothetical protein
MATAVTSELNERGGVELRGERCIYGNAPPRLQMEIAIDVEGDEFGGAGALNGRNVAALGP